MSEIIPLPKGSKRVDMLERMAIIRSFEEDYSKSGVPITERDRRKFAQIADETVTDRKRFKSGVPFHYPRNFGLGSKIIEGKFPKNLP